MLNLNIRTVTEDDLERCFEIEAVSYAGEEAATKDKILIRIRTYPQGFIVLENENEVIGFINSGATHNVKLSEEAFKELVGHDPDGKYVVILSVVVHPDYQGQGLASQLMANFIEEMKALGKAEIHLICQSALVPLYAKYGFEDRGESSSNHGGMAWKEMSLALR